MVDPVAMKLATVGGKLVLREASRRLKERRDAILVQRAEDLIGALTVAAELESVDEVAMVLNDAPDETVELFFEFAEQYARAVDPSVRPYLAKLTAPRLMHREAIDPYFRRVGAMLIGMDRSELDRLVDLMNVIQVQISDYVRSGTVHAVIVTTVPAGVRIMVNDSTGDGVGNDADFGEAQPALELLHGARLVSRGVNTYGGFQFLWPNERLEYLTGLLELFARKAQGQSRGGSHL